MIVSPRIRSATPEDVKLILQWLHEEHKLGDGDGFWNNRDLIRDGQARREVTVLVGDDDDPLAFCLMNHDALTILEVRPDQRRRGLGRELMTHVIQSARCDGMLGLQGFCEPQTSLPFWLSMGFELVHHPNRAMQIALPFRRRNHLPSDVARCDVTIDLFDDQFAQSLRKTLAIPAVPSDNRWLLQNDYVEYVYDPSTHLRIARDGKPVYCDKVKYVTDVGGERECPWIRIRTFTVKCADEG